jgi:hypothetical protein
MAAVDSFTPGTLVYFISTGRAAGWQPNKVYEGRIVSMNGNNVMVDFGDGNPMNLPKKLLNRDYNITVNGKTITVNQTILKLIYDRQPTGSTEELGNNIEVTAAANQMLLFGNVPLDAFQEDEAAAQMLTLGNDMTTDSRAAEMLENMKRNGGRSKRKKRKTRRSRKSRRR